MSEYAIAKKVHSVHKGIRLLNKMPKKNALYNPAGPDKSPLRHFEKQISLEILHIRRQSGFVIYVTVCRLIRKQNCKDLFTIGP